MSRKTSCFYLISFMILTFTSLASAATVHVQVLDDHGAGVKCKLFLINGGGKKVPLGETDEMGRVMVKSNGKKGRLLKIVPSEGNHYPTLRRFPRDGTVFAMVTKKSLFENLKGNAAYLEKKGVYGDAAMIYNEMMMRARGFDSEYAEQLRQKVIDVFGQFLKVEKNMVFDPLQDKKVISPVFKKKIQDYQKGNGIVVTGRIDYGTLSRAARQPVSRYLFNGPPSE